MTELVQGLEASDQQRRPGRALTVEAVYAAHHRSVWRWAVRLGGPALEPEDIVQEVFLVVAQKLSGFAERSRLSTWLFGITQNVIRGRRRREIFRRLIHRPSAEANPHSRASGPSPLDNVEQGQAERRFHLLLGGLAEKYRSALVLLDVEAMEPQAAADLLGIPLGTLRVWHHRARKHFLERLAALEAKENRA